MTGPAMTRLLPQIKQAYPDTRCYFAALKPASRKGRVWPMASPGRRPCTPQERRIWLLTLARGTRNRCTHTQPRAQVSSGGSSLARGREARILQSVRWAYGTRTIFQYSSRTVRTFTYSFFLTQHMNFACVSPQMHWYFGSMQGYFCRFRDNGQCLDMISASCHVVIAPHFARLQALCEYLQRPLRNLQAPQDPAPAGDAQ